MSHTPNDWMWAHACELLDQAERMQRQFFHLASPTAARAVWQPPVDVFEDEREVVVIVALPGVSPERIEVHTEGGTLVVRAQAALPFAGARRSVRRLEIPYGYFERRVPLPSDELEAGTRESADGFLILKLAKRAVKGSL